MATHHERLRIGIGEIDTLLGDRIALNELHEVRCSFSRDIGCACGFVVALTAQLKSAGKIVWITEPAIGDAGRLFPDGLAHFGFDAERLVQINPLHLNDALWAAGEAARNGSLAAIVFHVKGNPKMFDLSVSRKLMLRVQNSGRPFFILRQAGQEEASSTATRWYVQPEQSLPDNNFEKGVGHMRLRLTLEKNRNGQTGQWLIAYNPQSRSFEHAASNTATTHSGLPVYAPFHRPDLSAQMGQILAPEREKRQTS